MVLPWNSAPQCFPFLDLPPAYAPSQSHHIPTHHSLVLVLISTHFFELQIIANHYDKYARIRIPGPAYYS